MQAVLEVQQKTSLKNTLLQKRIQTLTDVAEHKESLLNEFANIKSDEREQISKKLQVGSTIEENVYL